ncbi:MAG TPA: hypothetical protein VHI13_03390 [Candidatus Kapabacteria bacterium]|nr:hypothetical protein [Candidatus Kapabacteria bacterium]
MEIVRPHTPFSHKSWKLPVSADRVGSSHEHQREGFDYVDSFTRGYSTGKHDGTLAGLLIGTIAGIAVAMMLSTMI